MHAPIEHHAKSTNIEIGKGVPLLDTNLSHLWNMDNLLFPPTSVFLNLPRNHTFPHGHGEVFEVPGSDQAASTIGVTRLFFCE
jgi:hypothetical protein